MDRNALLLYLQNVRDLEVARYWLQAQYQKEKNHYLKQKSDMEKTDFRLLPEDPGGLGCLFWGLLIMGLAELIAAFVMFGHAAGGAGAFFFIASIPFFIGTVAIFRSYQREREEYRCKYRTAVLHNESETKRAKENKVALPKLVESWKARNAWFQAENKKVSDALRSFYSMNILPVQFRKLSAVCYIYDYMSTSQESLTTALFDQHMEDGIRRLEAKLSSIISRLETMVYETRCIRQNSERMMAQNNHMLESLQRTESNTLQAAQYAELSANYSRANAYFSLATYLKS